MTGKLKWNHVWEELHNDVGYFKLKCKQCGIVAFDDVWIDNRHCLGEMQKI